MKKLITNEEDIRLKELKASRVRIYDQLWADVFHSYTAQAFGFTTTNGNISDIWTQDAET